MGERGKGEGVFYVGGRQGKKKFLLFQMPEELGCYSVAGYCGFNWQ